MLFAIKNREDLEILNKLVSLESQVKAVKLQDKLVKQNIHEDMKKVFEPVTKSIKDIPEMLAKTMTENSIKNNRALENLKDKLLEKMNDRGIIASYLLSPLFKITNPETTSHFKLVKGSNSKRVNDLLIHNTIPITSYNNMLTFSDTGKEFELKSDLFKMINNKTYIIDFASLPDKKLKYDFAKEMNFGVQAQGNESNRNRTLIDLLTSPGLMISASGISNTIILPSDQKDLCDRLKLLLQKKQAGNSCDTTNDEFVVILYKLLQYKCISKKQHKQFLIRCNLYHTRRK